MSNLTIPNTVANGLSADGNDVGANFDAIQTWADAHVLEVDGGTMTGNLVLAGAPSADLHAATKKYVDDKTWGTAAITDGAITSAKIADGTIATGDIADGAITSAKIADATIATGDLADGAVTSAKIADGTVTGTDIAADTITTANIAAGDFPDIKNTKLADYQGRILPAGAQSISNNTWTPVLFDGTEAYDYGAQHSPSVNPQLIGLPVAGVVHVDAGVFFVNNTTGQRGLRIGLYDSGLVLKEIVAEVLVGAAGGTQVTALSCSTDFLCAATDIIQIEVYQNSGGALNTSVTAGGQPTCSWHYTRLS